MCEACSSRGSVCSWTGTDGLTRFEDLKQRLDVATRRIQDLERFIETLRTETDENATMLLAKLRISTPFEQLHASIKTGQAPQSSSDEGG